MNEEIESIKNRLDHCNNLFLLKEDIRLLLSIIELQERAFVDICDELGCAYDNEAALMAADLLKRAARHATHPFSRYSPNVSWQSDPVWDLVLTNEELANLYKTLHGAYHGRLAGVPVKWLATAEREDGMFDVKVMELDKDERHNG